METEKTKEIRKEFCSVKGWNYLEFDCLEDAEEYIIFLERKVNNVVLDDIIKRFDCTECEDSGVNITGMDCTSCEKTGL